MITQQQFIEWNGQALIAGPEETEPQFIERVEFCQNIKNALAEHLHGQLSFQPEELASAEVIEETFCKSRHFYGMAPDWIPIFFTNHKLLPWHGGCAWIFQLSQSSPTSALFQLRKELKKKRQYLGLFDRDEIIVHEMAHVGRMAYEEPKFEELLAYRSSPSSFRRLLGPLVESSVESALFVLILLLILLLDLFLVFNGYDTRFFQAMWLKLIPLGMITFAAFRLFHRHRQMNGAHAKIKKIYHNDELAANAICYRLTDKEIIAFASWTPEQIRDYIKGEITRSLRWRQISACYPHAIFSFSH